jgi:hypothetical protein
MSGERSVQLRSRQAWSSEDTEPFSFKVVFTVVHGIVIGLAIRNKAPKLNVCLEAEAYWLRCGRVTPRSDVNCNCGIRVQWPCSDAKKVCFRNCVRASPVQFVGPEFGWCMPPALGHAARSRSETAVRFSEVLGGVPPPLSSGTGAGIRC